MPGHLYFSWGSSTTELQELAKNYNEKSIQIGYYFGHKEMVAYNKFIVAVFPNAAGNDQLVGGEQMTNMYRRLMEWGGGKRRCGIYF